jgi:hypothetical protein
VLRAVRNVVARLIQDGILSIRGAIALTGATLLCIEAWAVNDLAGAVVGPTLAAIVVISFIAVFWATRRNVSQGAIRLAIQPQSNAGSAQAEPNQVTTLTSGVPLVTSITCQALTVPLGCSLTLEPLFRVNASLEERALTNSPTPVTGRVSVRYPGEHRSSSTFPHRGNWSFVGTRAVLADSLRLTEALRILPPQNSSMFRVEPIQTLHLWEVVSSVERSGDTVQLSRERLGARLDLKQYHPSDGMRSIAWKIFARRGELVSRQPEAAATPEGTAVIFVAATTEHDEVAGAAVAYAKRCEELGSSIVAGVLGATRIARTANELLELVIESAPDATPERLALDTESFLKVASEISAGATLRRIALILPARESELFCAQLERMSGILNSQGVEAVALVAKREHQADHGTTTGNVPGWLFENPKQHSDAGADVFKRTATLGFTPGGAQLG